LIRIGKITGTHGLRGDVKVMPLTDFPERFFNMEKVMLGNETDFSVYFIEYVKNHKGYFLFKFRTIDDANSALFLKNKFLLIENEEAVKLPKDTYYIHEIIGLDVYIEDGRHIGKVLDIFRTGSNDVYVVGENEILIPALKDIIKIDIENNKMVVKDMPGLFSSPEEA